MRRGLPILATGFIAGAALRLAVPVPILAAGTAFLLLLAAGVRLATSRTGHILLVAATAALGAIWTSIWLVHPARDVSRLSGRRLVTVYGYVCREPVRRPDATLFDVRVSGARTLRGPEDAVGRVRVAVPPEAPAPEYGANLSVTGRLALPDRAANPGEVPTGHYLVRDGVSATLRAERWTQRVGNRGWPVMAAALRSKAALTKAIVAGLPQREAALLRGLLFSDTGSLDEADQNAFIRSGTVHVLSTSGLHVALLAGLIGSLWRSSRPSSRRWRSVFLMAALVFFALMTGLRPAVLRAVVMAGVVLAAPLVGREPDTWSSIALAALALVVISPANLLDPGFQLTFAAVVALALWADSRRGHRPSNRLPRPLAGLPDAVAISVVASLATAPIAALHFGSVSFAAPLTNLLVVPAVGPAMLLGMVQGATYGWMPPLAAAAAGLNRHVLGWMLGVTEGIAALPVAMESAYIPAAACAAGLACLAAWLWRLGAQRGPDAALARQASLASTVCLAAVAAYGCWQRPKLEVTFLDVGQADCALVLTPSGRTMLIDAGSAAPGAVERSILPALRRAGVRRLDVLLTTHAHDDHAGGVSELMKSMPVALWLHGEESDPGDALLSGLQTARDEGVPRRGLGGGEAIQLESGVRLDVLRPAPAGSGAVQPNDTSLGLVLTYGESRFCFTGDASADEESAWLSSSNPGPCDVLKVAHHGAASGTSALWLEDIRPRWCVISCGRNNRYGHPDRATLDRLAMYGATVFRTDEDGGVRFVTNGRTVTATDSRWALP